MKKEDIFTLSLITMFLGQIMQYTIITIIGGILTTITAYQILFTKQKEETK